VVAVRRVWLRADITSQTLSQKANRERMTQIMFETFCVPSMYTARAPQISIWVRERGGGGTSRRRFSLNLWCEEKHNSLSSPSSQSLDDGLIAIRKHCFDDAKEVVFISASSQRKHRCNKHHRKRYGESALTATGVIGALRVQATRIGTFVGSGCHLGGASSLFVERGGKLVVLIGFPLAAKV